MKTQYRKSYGSVYASQLKFGLFILMIVALLSIVQECAAQDDEEEYEEETVMDSLDYSQSQDIDHASMFPNGTTFARYIASDGSEIKVGDVLIFGKPSTNTNLYTYLYFGRVTIGKALFSTPSPLAGNMQTEKVVVEKIMSYHTKMSRKSTVGIVIHAMNPNSPKISNGRSIMDYEKAISLGEVTNPKKGMTREAAIAKLKEAKDLLDLEIITQDQYNTLKEELTPLIRR